MRIFFQPFGYVTILSLCALFLHAEDWPKNIPKNFYLGPCGTLTEARPVIQLEQTLKGNHNLSEKLRLLPNEIKFNFDADMGWLLLNFPKKGAQEIILQKGISHHTNHYYTYTKFVGKTRYYQNAMIQFSSLNLPFNGSWSWRKGLEERSEQIIRGKIQLSVIRYTDSDSGNFVYEIDGKEIGKSESWMFNQSKIPLAFKKGYLCVDSEPSAILNFFAEFISEKQK